MNATSTDAAQDQVIGRVFGTPLVITGRTWLPVAAGTAWLFLAWLAGRRRPERTLAQRLAMGAITMPVVLGSEWAHNLSHAAAARWVGKPMDALRVLFGMPRVIYYDVKDQSVTPNQHRLRALGGPVFNLGALVLALLLRHTTKPGSPVREVTDIAVGTNAFIGLAACLPYPFLDGGPVLKWSLVQHGQTPRQADQVVRRVNGVMGVGFALGTAAALKARRPFWGIIFGLLSLSGLAIAMGLLKE